MAGLQYKCPGCGAPIDFDISLGELKCEFCLSTFTVAQVEEYNAKLAQKYGADTGPANDGPRLKEEAGATNVAYPPDGPPPAGGGDGSNAGAPVPTPAKRGGTAKDKGQSFQALENKDVWDPSQDAGLAAFTCGSCGGEILATPDTVSTRCPYCDNNFVSRSQLETTLRPGKIIPFIKTKDDVLTTLKKSSRGKWFLPKRFKPENAIQDMAPMYLPFWLYDANVFGTVRFDAKNFEYWEDSDYKYTRTSVYRVVRSGSSYFQDIPVYAADVVPSRHTESIEPFDYSGVQPFSPAYLAGVITNKYSIGPDVCNKRAYDRMENSFAAALQDSVTGYDTVSVDTVDMGLGDNNVEYAFLPLWMLNLRHRDKVYTFAMNGQTGKFAGDFPISWGKLWACFGITAAVLMPLISTAIYLTMKF